SGAHRYRLRRPEDSRKRSALAATDTPARLRCARRRAGRPHPLPDAGIGGAEVSWRRLAERMRSLLRLFEISQIRRRLVLLGRHQEAVRAQEIIFLADD